MLNRMNLIWEVYLIITMKKMFFSGFIPFCVFQRSATNIPLMYSATLDLLLLSADQQQIICLRLTLASSSVLSLQ